MSRSRIQMKELTLQKKRVEQGIDSADDLPAQVEDMRIAYPIELPETEDESEDALDEVMNRGW